MDNDFFKSWLEVLEDNSVKKKPLKIFYELADSRDLAVTTLSSVIPNHYSKEETIKQRLETLGFKKTANLISEKLPKTKISRSGDLGEIIATELIRREFNYEIPLNKLVWKDGREQALRGDDVLGFNVDGRGTLKILKVEAKSRASLSTEVLKEAEAGLNSFKGRPNTHSLLFVADRLRESGNENLAKKIEKNVGTGFRSNQIEQFLFALCGNDPETLLKKKKRSYKGVFVRNYIAIHIDGHQAFIKAVFEETLGSL